MTFGFVLICGWNTIALWYCKYGLWLTKHVVYFSIAESWTFEEMFFSSSSSALVELCAHWINIYWCIVWLMELWSCSPGQILDGLLSPFCQVGRQLPVAHNELSPHSLPLALHTHTHTLPHTLSHPYFPLDSILTQTWVLHELWVGSRVVNYVQWADLLGFLSCLNCHWLHMIERAATRVIWTGHPKWVFRNFPLYTFSTLPVVVWPVVGVNAFSLKQTSVSRLLPPSSSWVYFDAALWLLVLASS